MKAKKGEYLGVHGPDLPICYPRFLHDRCVDVCAQPTRLWQDWLVLGGGQTVADAAAKVLPKAVFVGTRGHVAACFCYHTEGHGEAHHLGSIAGSSDGVFALLKSVKGLGGFKYF